MEILYLYVLELNEGKYYVGTTSNVEKRFIEHLEGQGSNWTNKYTPRQILYTRIVTSRLYEDFETELLMSKYGQENVRGGIYCEIELPQCLKEVLDRKMKHSKNQCFQCGKEGHFINNCVEKNQTYKSINPNRVCERCSRNNHSIDTCYVNTDINGRKLCLANVGNRKCKVHIDDGYDYCKFHYKQYT